MLGLMRRNPTLELSPFRDFERMFDDLFSSFSRPDTSLSLPSVDIYSEDDQSMVVEMQAPGFDRDDIEINVTGSVLEIRGERTEKEEHKDKKRSYMVRENSTSFARRILLPEGADTENVSAELDRGVLRVSIPVEQRQAKRVEIAAPRSKGSARLAARTSEKAKSK